MHPNRVDRQCPQRDRHERGERFSRILSTARVAPEHDADFHAAFAGRRRLHRAYADTAAALFLDDCEKPRRQRLPHRGSGFSASPVMADGRIYLPGEDGDIFIVRAGRTFELLGTQSVGEPIMATPAITGGTMFVRGERTLFAIGQ